MRSLTMRLLILVLMVGFLVLSSMGHSEARGCNNFCWRSCNDQFNECLNNNSYETCCGQFNQCITSCGTSCIQCQQ